MLNPNDANLGSRRRSSLQNALKGRFKCLLCEKAYSFKKHLTVHIKNIHGEFSLPVQCPVCFNSYKNKESLRVHLKGSHSISNTMQIKYSI